MTQAVRALYQRNRQRGHAAWCNTDYDFVCPSLGTYPFQWFWDSCFHAIVLSHFDLDRARAELRTLLHNAAGDGLVSHVTLWQRERFEKLLATYSIAYRTPYLSDCMQPPVLAEAVEAVYRRSNDRAFLDEILPKVRAFFDWCARVRDPDQDGLIAVLQVDETGLDHVPKFDTYLGIGQGETAPLDDFTAGWEGVAGPYAKVGRDPQQMFALDLFVVEEVMVNTIYAHNQEVLGALLAEVGDRSGAAEMQRRAQKGRQALYAKCWHEGEGLFFDLAGLGERMLEENSFTSLMPLLLSDLDPERAKRLIAQIEDPSSYAARYPVPSVPLSAKAFRAGDEGAQLLWRGPTWLNSNWYLARGLKTHGRGDLAAVLVERSVELIEKSGFREFYNPHTGEGYGAHDFSWTALVLDMLSG
ncbi:MAG: trehalase family glycosidase [Acidobacteriota bacterium]